MDKVTELANQLKQELDSLPLFEEYKRLNRLVDESEELDSLKKEIVKNADNSDKHNELLSRYNNHPLVVNYEASKEALYELLKTIETIIK